MTIEQFRAKWGQVFSSLLICELITRIDSNAQLTATANELADDLRKLLAVETRASTGDFNTNVSAGFPRRLERLDSVNTNKESER
jgi:hypothetical protein